MGKLNAALLRYLSKDDFRVLTGVRSCRNAFWFVETCDSCNNSVCYFCLSR